MRFRNHVLSVTASRWHSVVTTGLDVFIEALPLTLVRQFAVRADERGVRTAWFPEITFADAFIPAAASAIDTKRLRLATGVVGIWSRSPVVMALTAYTLHQLGPGRSVLGLGLQAKPYVVNWHGEKYEKTVTAMREYVTIVRRILAGETVTFEGEVFRVKGFQIPMPPADPPIPIYVAAIGPKMTELAGEIADGVFGFMHSLPYFRNVVVPAIRTGAARAGRSLDTFDLAVGFPAIVTADDSGIALNKGQIVMFATAMGSSRYYAESFTQAGFGNEVQRIQELVARGEMKKAIEVVSDEMCDALTLSGSPSRIYERIAAYRAAGATTVALNPSPPGVYFPLFQGHFPDNTELPAFSFPDFLKSIGDAIDFIGESQH